MRLIGSVGTSFDVVFRNRRSARTEALPDDGAAERGEGGRAAEGRAAAAAAVGVRAQEGRGPAARRGRLREGHVSDDDPRR